MVDDSFWGCASRVDLTYVEDILSHHENMYIYRYISVDQNQPKYHN